MRRLSVLFAILWLAALAGCGGGARQTDYIPLPDPGPVLSGDLITTREQARQHARWTILVYLDADNDLESAGTANFDQMEMVGSTTDVRIIVQMDRIRGYDDSSGDWTDTRRYLVTRDTDSTTMKSVRLDDQPLGELDMADWHTLRDFVQWGKAEFPADHYCLVMWDHGTGWAFRSRSLAPAHRYIAADDTSGGHMDVTDIPRALEGLNVDVIAFDACLMQQIEVAYELKGCASYMVASPAAEPSPGYNYYTLLARVRGDTTPLELSKAIVQDYARTYTAPRRAIIYSALDLSRMDDLAAALDGFARLLIPNGPHTPGLSAARDNSLNYSTADGGINRYYRDPRDYARRCAAAIGPPADAPLAALEAALGAAVVAESHNPDTPAATGLGIYIPSAYHYDPRYEMLTFTAATQWDEWLRSQF